MAEDNNNCMETVNKILKVLEAIFLVICTSAVGYYLNNREGYFDDRKKLEFFIDASVVSITVVALFILIWLFEIHNRAGFVFFVVAILMLIASSLLAKFDADCNDEKNSNGKSRCSQITAGVVTGFCAVVALVVDAIVYCMRSSCR